VMNYPNSKDKIWRSPDCHPDSISVSFVQIHGQMPKTA
jgi:hypothetical protein